MEPVKEIKSPNDYVYVVGSVLYLCQCIEHDIKYIYFLMSGDHSDEFFNHIKSMRLEEVIDNLEQYESLNELSVFSSDDYDLLRRINVISGYYAHECYVDWVYEEDENKKDLFKESSNQLIKDHNILLELHRVIEDLRIELFASQK